MLFDQNQIPLSFVFPENYETISQITENDKIGTLKNHKIFSKEHFSKPAISMNRFSKQDSSKEKKFEYELTDIDPLRPSTFLGHAIFKDHILLTRPENSTLEKRIGKLELLYINQTVVGCY
jgi:hypothetical protein